MKIPAVAERLVEYRRKYNRRPNAKEQRMAYSTRNAEQVRIAHAAHEAVRRAVMSGRLVRPSACSQCDRTGGIEAAHSDYALPLKVRWLCRPCHRRWDKQEPKLFGRKGDQRHIRRYA